MSHWVSQNSALRSWAIFYWYGPQWRGSLLPHQAALSWLESVGIFFLGSLLAVNDKKRCLGQKPAYIPSRPRLSSVGRRCVAVVKLCLGCQHPIWNYLSESLPLTWDTWLQFWPPDFVLAQRWLLWAFGEWTSRWKNPSCVVDMPPLRYVRRRLGQTQCHL